eukprot:TRINITY_DN1024_c0_g2_i7.p1 TRINITY_DN1024_c0_g2~~TRINITY_DN1024_c0_g2_i7.p1  ORF type:complete len:158 (+),score=19.54 TRINITY_DN1024_c0_g2_i7:340-813(+)
MTDTLEIAKLIAIKGTLQLTDAERKEIMRKKRNEIGSLLNSLSNWKNPTQPKSGYSTNYLLVTYIHKYYVDPKTKTPHPALRIDNALNTLKYRVDPDVPVDKQVTEIMRNLPGILPVKKMEVTGVITIPHAFLGNSPQIIRDYATVKSERYIDTGCM